MDVFVWIAREGTCTDWTKTFCRGFPISSKGQSSRFLTHSGRGKEGVATI